MLIQNTAPLVSPRRVFFILTCVRVRDAKSCFGSESSGSLTSALVQVPVNAPLAPLRK